jgi:hypothetical protein
MTKAQALAKFRSVMMPALTTLYGQNREMAYDAWSDYEHYLEETGQITWKQFISWKNPYAKN